MRATIVMRLIWFCIGVAVGDMRLLAFMLEGSGIRGLWALWALRLFWLQLDNPQSSTKLAPGLFVPKGIQNPGSSLGFAMETPMSLN